VLLSPLLVGTAFVLVLPAELPDKTMLATLLLTARYRPLPVLVGVSGAFAVQCTIAVAFGSVLSLLPQRAAAAVVAVLFGIGAILLLREGFGASPGEDSSSNGNGTGTGTGNGTEETSTVRITGISFGVLFAAEWGDASQFAIAALTARFGAPLAVGIGAWLALVTVAGFAVLVGNRLAHRLPTRWIQRVAGLLFAAFALFAGYEAIML
jgi:putative Ca2+/H+ antiporter (TMEM165/GDT1 family)